MRTSSTRRIGAASGAALLALMFNFATPAFAGGNGHGGSKTSGTTVTEDNDNNDGGTPNNVPDAGDNRHPSGKDRSVENGGSGNQGKSTSDPDGSSNGGPDKPGGSGGIDKADQDGNNGCGNDDDFEDDNNGNCGGHHKATGGTECPQAGEMSDHGKGKGKGSTAEGDCDHVGGTDHECTGTMPAGADKDHECAEHGCTGTMPAGADKDDECAEHECTGTMPAGADKDHECDEHECTGTMPAGADKDDDCGETPPVVGGTNTEKCENGSMPTTGDVTTGCLPAVVPGTTPSDVLAGNLTSAPASLASVSPTNDSQVLGLELERSPATGAAAVTPAAATTGTSVLGAALARTGFGLTMVALALALGLLAVGFALKRAGRRSDI